MSLGELDSNANEEVTAHFQEILECSLTARYRTKIHFFLRYLTPHQRNSWRNLVPHMNVI